MSSCENDNGSTIEAGPPNVLHGSTVEMLPWLIPFSEEKFLFLRKTKICIEDILKLIDKFSWNIHAHFESRFPQIVCKKYARNIIENIKFFKHLLCSSNLELNSEFYHRIVILLTMYIKIEMHMVLGKESDEVVASRIYTNIYSCIQGSTDFCPLDVIMALYDENILISKSRKVMQFIFKKLQKKIDKKIPPTELQDRQFIKQVMYYKIWHNSELHGNKKDEVAQDFLHTVKPSKSIHEHNNAYAPYLFPYKPDVPGDYIKLMSNQINMAFLHKIYTEPWTNLRINFLNEQPIFKMDLTEDDIDEVPMIKIEVAPFGPDEVIEILDDDEDQNEGENEKIKHPTYFNWYFESIKLNMERLLGLRNTHFPTRSVVGIITLNDDDDCVMVSNDSNASDAITEIIEDKIPHLCESLQSVAMENIEGAPSINENVPPIGEHNSTLVDNLSSNLEKQLSCTITTSSSTDDQETHITGDTVSSACVEPVKISNQIDTCMDTDVVETPTTISELQEMSTGSNKDDVETEIHLSDCSLNREAATIVTTQLLLPSSPLSPAVAKPVDDVANSKGSVESCSSSASSILSLTPVLSNVKTYSRPKKETNPIETISHKSLSDTIKYSEIDLYSSELSDDDSNASAAEEFRTGTVCYSTSKPSTINMRNNVTLNLPIAIPIKSNSGKKTKKDILDEWEADEDRLTVPILSEPTSLTSTKKDISSLTDINEKKIQPKQKCITFVESIDKISRPTSGLKNRLYERPSTPINSSRIQERKSYLKRSPQKWQKSSTCYSNYHDDGMQPFSKNPQFASPLRSPPVSSNYEDTHSTERLNNSPDVSYETDEHHYRILGSDRKHCPQLGYYRTPYSSNSIYDENRRILLKNGVSKVPFKCYTDKLLFKAYIQLQKLCITPPTPKSDYDIYLERIYDFSDSESSMGESLYNDHIDMNRKKHTTKRKSNSYTKMSYDSDTEAIEEDRPPQRKKSSMKRKSKLQTKKSISFQLPFESDTEHYNETLIKSPNKKVTSTKNKNLKLTERRKSFLQDSTYQIVADAVTTVNYNKTASSSSNSIKDRSLDKEDSKPYKLKRVSFKTDSDKDVDEVSSAQLKKDKMLTKKTTINTCNNIINDNKLKLKPVVVLESINSFESDSSFDHSILSEPDLQMASVRPKIVMKFTKKKNKAITTTVTTVEKRKSPVKRTKTKAENNDVNNQRRVRTRAVYKEFVKNTSSRYEEEKKDEVTPPKTPPYQHWEIFSDKKNTSTPITFDKFPSASNTIDRDCYDLGSMSEPPPEIPNAMKRTSRRTMQPIKKSANKIEIKQLPVLRCRSKSIFIDSTLVDHCESEAKSIEYNLNEELSNEKVINKASLNSAVHKEKQKNRVPKKQITAKSRKNVKKTVGRPRTRSKEPLPIDDLHEATTIRVRQCSIRLSPTIVDEFVAKKAKKTRNYKIFKGASKSDDELYNNSNRDTDEMTRRKRNYSCSLLGDKKFVANKDVSAKDFVSIDITNYLNKFIADREVSEVPSTCSNGPYILCISELEPAPALARSLKNVEMNNGNNDTDEEIQNINKVTKNNIVNETISTKPTELSVAPAAATPLNGISKLKKCYSPIESSSTSSPNASPCSDAVSSTVTEPPTSPTLHDDITDSELENEKVKDQHQQVEKLSELNNSMSSYSSVSETQLIKNDFSQRSPNEMIAAEDDDDILSPEYEKHVSEAESLHKSTNRKHKRKRTNLTEIQKRSRTVNQSSHKSSSGDDTESQQHDSVINASILCEEKVTSSQEILQKEAGPIELNSLPLINDAQISSTFDNGIYIIPVEMKKRRNTIAVQTNEANINVSGLKKNLGIIKRRQSCAVKSMFHNLPYPSNITNKTLPTTISPLNKVIEALHKAKMKIEETKPPASDEFYGSTRNSANVSRTYSKDGVVANVFVPPDIEKIIAEQQQLPVTPQITEFETTKPIVKKKLIDTDKKKLEKNHKRKYQHAATLSKEQFFAPTIAKRKY